MREFDANRAKLLLADWERLVYAVGAGWVAVGDACIRLTLDAQDGTRYGDAQLDDYHTAGVLGWRPPVRLRIRARFSHAAAMLRGTAGFGFWNDPFGMTKAVMPLSWLPKLRLPQAVWFFFALPPGISCASMQMRLDSTMSNRTISAALSVHS